MLLGPTLGLWSATASPRMRAGALAGALWGAAFIGTLVTWMLELHVAAYVALVLTQTAFFALIGAGVAWLSPIGTVPWVLGAAGLWTIADALRARLPLGGFEWGGLGVGLAPVGLRSAAAIVGALGLTGLVVAVAAALARLGSGADLRRGLRTLAAALAALALTALLGALPWTSVAGEVDVAIVQTDDPCPGEFSVDCPNVRERTQDGLIAEGDNLSLTPDLLVWGEGTLRGDDPDDAGRLLLERVGDLEAPLLAGITSPVPPALFRNRNVMFDTDGRPQAYYDKRQPVPFGEYVPWRDALGWIGDVGRLVPSDMVRGVAAVPITLPEVVREDGAEVTLGTVVSWEVTFARLVRDAAREGEAVATLTTQASYGTAPVSDQLLGAAQLRANETGRAQIVAATTGRSAVLHPRGDMAGPTALFAADHLETVVELREGSTPYLWWGDAGALLLAALALGYAVFRRFEAAQSSGLRGEPPQRILERVGR